MFSANSLCLVFHALAVEVKNVCDRYYDLIVFVFTVHDGLSISSATLFPF